MTTQPLNTPGKPGGCPAPTGRRHVNPPAQPPGQGRYLNGKPAILITAGRGRTSSTLGEDHLAGPGSAQPQAAGALGETACRRLRPAAAGTAVAEARWPPRRRRGIAR